MKATSLSPCNECIFHWVHWLERHGNSREEPPGMHKSFENEGLSGKMPSENVFAELGCKTFK